MKNFRIALGYTSIFLVFSAILFLVQYILAQQGVMALNYRIHFLLFFVTFICILSISLVFVLKKKNIIGFVFLGFVVFKIFAIGYIALFEPDFEKAILPYFALYWLYLAVEVFYVIKFVKKQD